MKQNASVSRSRRVAFLLSGIFLFLGVSSFGANPMTPPTVRPAGAVPSGGTTVVPDHFLRRWDPVTVFFPRDTGPAGGGPEDRPERYVRMSPAHPGAFTWVDARTLQFQPAEPWPPLARSTWRAGGSEFVLTTLMAAPVETRPAPNAADLDPVDAIAMTFPEPIDPGSLARMVTIELRPLPGIQAAGREKPRWLNLDDFRIKTLERASRSDAATYVLNLNNPIPVGMRAIVRVRLSLDDDAEKSFTEFSFATALPFRVVSAGPPSMQYPVTSDGSRYARDKAINGGSEGRYVEVTFSTSPRPLGAVEIRNLVRFTPAVDNLVFHQQGTTLRISGAFAWDTVYGMALSPTPLSDESGRTLEMKRTSELFFYFPRRPSYLRWGKSQGVVERFGPQRVPAEGRGMERVDIRIYPVKPLDRSFWPFSGEPVAIDESKRPPGPGEIPAPFTDAQGQISMAGLVRQLAALGSPPVSRIVTLPLRKEGGSATFGLDLEPHLTFLSGQGKPGHYLVGLRRLDTSNERSWMRIQVTDLCLTTLEEPRAVRFQVTSLSTGLPVAGAAVRVEGNGSDSGWTNLAEGTTDPQGAFRWNAPGPIDDDRQARVRRIVVEKDGDLLVLDPAQPPQGYADNHWQPMPEPWLQWAVGSLAGREPPVLTLCHIFTERPVYRPDEKVYIKGYLRQRERGHLSLLPMEGFVVVEGPGDLKWRYPVTLNAAGSFYHAFSEEKLPTGEYTAHLEEKKIGTRYGKVTFRLEAYRIPEFEVALHGPTKTPMDKEFEVSLTATYYAGGRVAGMPVQWRVTQFPQAWTPKKREGFLYSSDGRFSRVSRFEASPRLEKQGKTDEQGTASVAINPGVEPSAQARNYIVEATVTGADDQTVTASRSVLAVPSFVLGLKVPRFLEKAEKIEPEVIVVGPEGELLPGKEVVVRLLRRQWHSVLRESDFSDGVARYVTDVVDEKVTETRLKSAEQPVLVPLPVPDGQPGVYIVEIEARDRLDRAQVVSVDLYAGGDGAVTWPKPSAGVFSVSTEKETYDPGDTALIVLKSPFQSARALAVVEAPEGNVYEWIAVTGGSAAYRLPLKNTYAPKVPVHFILMRGRLAGAPPLPGSATDLGKPATLAATAWVQVAPAENRVEVELTCPEKARPGQTISVTIRLSEPAKGGKGKPLPGEVTLWLVDQAVLALGKEQRLDPLPDFITPVRSRLTVRDTRNLAFGLLPFIENPGGEAADKEKGILERATVRKRFQTVPYYNPAIAVGPDGTVTVTVELPDNLTNFKLRAKAVSGPERFGFAVGHIAVRLPVIVQPALPRFVRPGDAFTAAAIARVVEGESGPGAAEVKTVGVNLSGPAKRDLSFVPNRPERIEFPVVVTTPPYGKDGKPAYRDVTFRVGVTRLSDAARDAFEVKLPIREDRRKVTRRVFQDLSPGVPANLPAIPEAARPGTVRRTVLVSDQPALVRMAAGLDFLLNYPYGCTEQRVSLARARLGLKKFRDLLHMEGSDADLDRSIRETLGWISNSVDANGLAAYWPGAPGRVSLSAWVLEFLVDARAAGYPVDEKLFATLSRSLTQALRSDYSRFIDGEAFNERAYALSALASAGKFDASYGAELTRKAKYLDLEGVARVSTSFARAGQLASPAVGSMTREMWDGLIVRLYQGREIFGGLQDRHGSRNGLILPSETRTVAEVTRALAKADPKNPRFPLLIDALVTLGRDDGWGTTNANAAALLALAEILSPPSESASPRTVQVTFGKNDATSRQTLTVGPKSPTGYLVSGSAAAGEVLVKNGAGARPVVLRAEASYVPLPDGSQAAPESQGFVVTRELLRMGGKNEGKPAERLRLETPGSSAEFAIGEVVEEHVRVVNPADRHYVAVSVPLAAGMEPLNPNLATAPPEARTAVKLTATPTYAAYMDDQVTFYYDTLPKGTYDFYFRTRATTAGRFIQPPAQAEMMYDGAVRGNSAGARVIVTRKE